MVSACDTMQPEQDELSHLHQERGPQHHQQYQHKYQQQHQPKLEATQPQFDCFVAEIAGSRCLVTRDPFNCFAPTNTPLLVCAPVPHDVLPRPKSADGTEGYIRHPLDTLDLNPVPVGKINTDIRTHGSPDGQNTISRRDPSLNSSSGNGNPTGIAGGATRRSTRISGLRAASTSPGPATGDRPNATSLATIAQDVRHGRGRSARGGSSQMRSRRRCTISPAAGAEASPAAASLKAACSRNVQRHMQINPAGADPPGALPPALTRSDGDISTAPAVAVAASEAPQLRDGPLYYVATFLTGDAALYANKASRSSTSTSSTSTSSAISGGDTNVGGGPRLRVCHPAVRQALLAVCSLLVEEAGAFGPISRRRAMERLRALLMSVAAAGVEPPTEAEWAMAMGWPSPHPPAILQQQMTSPGSAMQQLLQPSEAPPSGRNCNPLGQDGKEALDRHEQQQQLQRQQQRLHQWRKLHGMYDHEGQVAVKRPRCAHGEMYGPQAPLLLTETAPQASNDAGGAISISTVTAVSTAVSIFAGATVATDCGAATVMGPSSAAVTAKRPYIIFEPREISQSEPGKISNRLHPKGAKPICDAEVTEHLGTAALAPESSNDNTNDTDVTIIADIATDTYADTIANSNVRDITDDDNDMAANAAVAVSPNRVDTAQEVHFYPTAAPAVELERVVDCWPHSKALDLTVALVEIAAVGRTAVMVKAKASGLPSEGHQSDAVATEVLELTGTPAPPVAEAVEALPAGMLTEAASSLPASSVTGKHGGWSDSDDDNWMPTASQIDALVAKYS